MMNEEFEIPPGVTIVNALRYVNAIEQAVKREITRIPKSERGMVTAMVAGALRVSSDALNNLREKMEKTGEADPITDEQRLQLRMLFRNAMEKNRSS